VPTETRDLTFDPVPSDRWMRPVIVLLSVTCFAVALAIAGLLVEGSTLIG
jgi:hypothetical protein